MYIVKVNVKVSRIQISIWLHMFFRLPPLAVAAQQPATINLNIFYFIYMKWDWAEHRCYVKALSLKPATIDPTLICAPGTHYGWVVQCGIRILPDTSTHGRHWESNPRPSDLDSNAISTWTTSCTSSSHSVAKSNRCNLHRALHWAAHQKRSICLNFSATK